MVSFEVQKLEGEITQSMILCDGYLFMVLELAGTGPMHPLGASLCDTMDCNNNNNAYKYAIVA